MPLGENFPVGEEDFAKLLGGVQLRPGVARLGTSASKRGNVNIGVTTFTVSDILQGAALHKPTALAFDQQNQLLTSDLQSLIQTGGGFDTVVGEGRAEFTPFDVLLKEGFNDGRINLEKSGSVDTPQNNAIHTVKAGTPAQIGDNPDIKIVNGKTLFTHRVSGEQVYLVTWNGVTLAEDFMAKWKPLAEKGAAEGIELDAWGWRSYDEQVALRVKNGCPDKFNSRPGACRVPTARPGYSNHEMGRAVDVKNTTNEKFNWLKANAEAYGVYNLPSESWHWSADGN